MPLRMNVLFYGKVLTSWFQPSILTEANYVGRKKKKKTLGFLIDAEEENYSLHPYNYKFRNKMYVLLLIRRRDKPAT